MPWKTIPSVRSMKAGRLGEAPTLPCEEVTQELPGGPAVTWVPTLFDFNLWSQWCCHQVSYSFHPVTQLPIKAVDQFDQPAMQLSESKIHKSLAKVGIMYIRCLKASLESPFTTLWIFSREQAESVSSLQLHLQGPFPLHQRHSSMNEPWPSESFYAYPCKRLRFFPNFGIRNLWNTRKLHHIFSWDVPGNCRDGVIFLAHTGQMARDSPYLLLLQQLQELKLGENTAFTQKWC